MIGSRIFSKNLGYFQNNFEMKIQLKSTLYFCFVSKLIWSRNSHWKKYTNKRFIKFPITLLFWKNVIWSFFLCHTAKQNNSFINFSETYSCIFVKDKKPESIGVLWSAVVLWKIEYHPCQESWRLKKVIL